MRACVFLISPSKRLKQQHSYEDNPNDCMRDRIPSPSHPSLGCCTIVPTTNREFNEISISTRNDVTLGASKTKSIRRRFRYYSWLCTTLVLEVLIVFVFIVLQSIVSIDHIAHTYFVPWIELQRWTPEKRFKDVTYYQRECNKLDQTAFDPTELIIDDDIEIDNLIDDINRHGAQILPNLLTESTATELRTFVLEQNKKNENMIGVIAQVNRWSFAVQVDQHPSVGKALKEMLSNELLSKVFQATFGSTDPALYELVVLTSAYGATDQYWHPDVTPEASSAIYGRNFFHFYSLFIPLQNTTGAMGATGICPGTHMCGSFVDKGDYFDETCFQVSGRQDLWQTGWGAFVNTKLIHKGSAHTDPNGTERVLLIPSFAPRPVKPRNHQLETRSIPHGGVYGLHWSQWGHTVSDILNFETVMRQPWRTIRSMGVFGHSWTFLDQALHRIANNDVGYIPEDVVDFCMSSMPWLPSFLFGRTTDADGDSLEEKWMATFLLESVKRIKLVMECLQYFLMFVLVYMFIRLSQRRHIKNQVAYSLLRLITLKCFIIIISSIALGYISSSSWANNIRTKRSMNLPELAAQFPFLPATLPLNDDILMTKHMQSDYLGAYSQSIQSWHPGNRVWTNEIVPQYSIGFENLTPAVKNELCTFIVRSLEHEGRRILARNTFSNWAIPTDEQLRRFCHVELITATQPFLKVAVRQLDYLWTETQYGYWRDTVLHRKILPDYLMLLQDKILNYQQAKVSNAALSSASVLSESHMSTKSFLPQFPSAASLSFKRRSMSGYRASLNSVEPYSGAWLKEGDIVEAYFIEKDIGAPHCWYPAKIKIATADQYQYYVRFFDGEYGQKPRDMVRPLKPFQIHDRIEVQLSVEDDFVPARVIGTHEGNAIVTVIIDENGTTHTVPTSSIRRECNVILFGNGVSSEEFFKNATQPSYEQVTNGTTIRGADVLQLFTELFS